MAIKIYIDRTGANHIDLPEYEYIDLRHLNNSQLYKIIENDRVKYHIVLSDIKEMDECLKELTFNNEKHQYEIFENVDGKWQLKFDPIYPDEITYNYDDLTYFGKYHLKRKRVDNND